MDFVCQRDDFARGITTVERAVSTKDNMPILEGIYIRAHQDGLQLIANAWTDSWPEN